MPFAYYEKSTARRWYTGLSNATIEREHFDSHKSNIIVCHWKNEDDENEELQGNHFFSIFSNYIEFGLYQYKYRREPWMRSEFEVVLGQYPQKPHFDIDIVKEEYEALNLQETYGEFVIRFFSNVIYLIRTIMEEKNIILNNEYDFAIYMSSNPTIKASFHIILPRYYHINNEEARALRDLVASRLPPDLIPYGRFLDKAFYSAKQQIRIVGNQKPGSNRVKILQPFWIYCKPGTENISVRHRFMKTPEDEAEEYMLQLEECLVSNIYACQKLPSFKQQLIAVRPPSFNFKTGNDITLDQSSKSLEYLSKLEGGINHKMRAIQGNLIILNRLHPSHCNLCGRDHQAENSYIIIKDGYAYFDCRRRSDNKKTLLGPV